ncbi:MAG: hypothetical protein ABIN35_01735 [candidate division WOR-3 bacterium]
MKRRKRIVKKIILCCILMIFTNIYSQIVLPDASFDHKYFDYFEQGINANFTTSQLSNSFNLLYLWNSDFFTGLGLKVINYGTIDYTTVLDTTSEPSPINYPYIIKNENLNKLSFTFFFGKKTKFLNCLFNLNFNYLNFSKNPIILTNSLNIEKILADYSLFLNFYDLLPVQNFGEDYEYVFEPQGDVGFSKLFKKDASSLKISFVVNFLTYLDDGYTFVYKFLSLSPSLELDYKYKNIALVLNTFSEKFEVSFLYTFSEKFAIFSSYGKNYSSFQYFSIGINFKGVNN